MTLRIALLAACLGVAALGERAAAQAPVADTAAAAHARPPRRNENLITREEIEGVSAHDARDLIARLRPRWLRPYGATSGVQGQPATVFVYLDGTRIGTAQRELVRITAEQIGEIEFVPGREAAARFGPGYSPGVILISSR